MIEITHFLSFFFVSRLSTLFSVLLCIKFAVSELT